MASDVASLRQHCATSDQGSPVKKAAWGRRLRTALLAGTALSAAAASPALAQNIDTTPLWNGTTFISSWGTTNTATYGQTFTPTGNLQSFLTSFTFNLGFSFGTPPQYQAFVYQFNPTTNLIVGPALFSSGVLTAPTNAAGYTPVTINTGRIGLTSGTQYVLMFTTSVVPGQPASSYRYGSLTNNTAIPNGQFVFENNGATGFAALFTTPWSNIAEDLATLITFSPAFLTQLLPTNAPTNPTNVARAIDNFTNNGGVLPAGFNSLYTLSGPALVSALTQLDGEVATQAQQGGFRIMDSFLELMLSPLADNHSTGFGPIAKLPDSQQPPSLRTSYAALGDAPGAALRPVRNYDVWGAAFGASDHLGGNTGTGSTDSRNQSGGFAVGLDYKAIPNVLLGVVIGGGGQNWSLGNSLGTGGSDVLQVGAYATANYGPFYLSGAFGYGQFWNSTTRVVSVASPSDSLKANFEAEDFAGRFEGGYHMANLSPVMVTPYAAIQPQSFSTPSFSEFANPGSSSQFALNFRSHTATSVRAELGSWANTDIPLADGSSINMFGRIAWAHDDSSSPTLGASFINLPAVNGFRVTGAKPGDDRGVLTAGAEWKMDSGWALMGRFDAEAGANISSVKATARARYAW